MICSCGLEHSLKIEDITSGSYEELADLLKKNITWPYKNPSEQFVGEGHLLLGKNSEVVSYIVYSLGWPSLCSIHWIMTKDEYRKGGFAAQMLHHLQNTLPEGTRITGRGINEKGTEFLKKLGFKSGNNELLFELVKGDSI